MAFPIDAQFPNMETFVLNLYFDGTRANTAVARSFAAFGGSYAPVYSNSKVCLVARVYGIAYVVCDIL
jgi:hypothetical protein